MGLLIAAVCWLALGGVGALLSDRAWVREFHDRNYSKGLLAVTVMLGLGGLVVGIIMYAESTPYDRD